MFKIRFFFMLFASALLLYSCSEKNTGISGLWKLEEVTSGKPSTLKYIIFKSDSTFVMNVDSTGKAGPQIVNGNWTITPDKELKLAPDEKAVGDPAYYVNIDDNKYEFRYFDKGSVKTKVNTT